MLPKTHSGQEASWARFCFCPPHFLKISQSANQTLPSCAGAADIMLRAMNHILYGLPGNEKSTSPQQVGQTKDLPPWWCAKPAQQGSHIQTWPKGTKTLDGFVLQQITYSVVPAKSLLRRAFSFTRAAVMFFCSINSWELCSASFAAFRCWRRASRSWFRCFSFSTSFEAARTSLASKCSSNALRMSSTESLRTTTLSKLHSPGNPGNEPWTACSDLLGLLPNKLAFFWGTHCCSQRTL